MFNSYKREKGKYIGGNRWAIAKWGGRTRPQALDTSDSLLSPLIGREIRGLFVYSKGFVSVSHRVLGLAQRWARTIYLGD